MLALPQRRVVRSRVKPWSAGRRVQHRGPDDSGIEVVDGVGLGHTRLSILDPSPTRHQPMVQPGLGMVDHVQRRGVQPRGAAGGAAAHRVAWRGVAGPIPRPSSTASPCTAPPSWSASTACSPSRRSTDRPAPTPRPRPLRHQAALCRPLRWCRLVREGARGPAGGRLPARSSAGRPCARRRPGLGQRRRDAPCSRAQRSPGDDAGDRPDHA